MRKVACLLVLAGLATATAIGAEDGAALFQSKCASCHGAKGNGRPAMKGTDLLSPDVRKASDEKLTEAILNGGVAKKAAHVFSKKGITPEQAKALVAHIRELQK